jgi:hypothetical protein
LEQARIGLRATFLGCRALKKQALLLNKYFNNQTEFVEDSEQLLEQSNVALTELEATSV